MELGRNEVLERIVASLSSSAGVEEAAYFGSTARGEVDALSDIDLVVQCDADAASRLVHRLHEVMEVIIDRVEARSRGPSRPRR